jgi:hypothetical protein
MWVIAAKLRLNDVTLSCGTLDGLDEAGAAGALELDGLLLQAAPTRAALAATAVRTIVLLLIKPNETTSIYGIP